MPTVGYIGLGEMGAPIAERIVRGGFRTMVWNRSLGRIAALVEAGAIAGASPADLARHCDVLFFCVANAEAIEEILFGADGVVAAGASRAALIVDNSTVHPERTRDIAARLKAAVDIAWLDVPVSGGPVGARVGTLAAMAGGAAADLERVRSIIATFASRVTHMGGVGAGQAAKICNQVINFGTIAAIAEALSLGRRCGIEARRLPEALAGGFADSNMLREYDRAMAAGESGNVTLLINGLIDFLEGRKAFCIPLLALANWGRRWFGNGELGQDVLHKSCGEPLATVVVCDHCKAKLEPHDVDVVLSSTDSAGQPSRTVARSTR